MSTIHGIAPGTPGWVDRLLAFHRNTFGDAQMNGNTGDGGTGSGGTGEGQGGTGGTGTGTETGSGGTGEGQGNPPNPQVPIGPDGKPWDFERQQRALEAARTAEKDANGKAKAESDKLKAVLTALGLGEDGKPDADQIAKDLSSTQAAQRALQVENLVLRNAGKAGADGDALLDSRQFLAKLKGIDPAEADAPDKVLDAIKAATEGDAGARFRLAPAQGQESGQGAGRAGAQMSGRGPGDGNSSRAKTLDDAIAAAFSANK